MAWTTPAGYNSDNAPSRSEIADMDARYNRLVKKAFEDQAYQQREEGNGLPPF